MRFILLFFFINLNFCSSQNEKRKPFNTDERLDDVITHEFKKRDLNGDGIVTCLEILSYYRQHPEKMSEKGMEFLEKNFNDGRDANLEQYRTIIKQWLGETGSVAKILDGVFGNQTHLSTHKLSNNATLTL